MDNDIFQSKTKSNALDRLEVNLPQLYKDFPIDHKQGSPDHDRFFTKGKINYLYRFPLLPLSYRSKLWQWLGRLNIDQRWLEEFRVYWTEVLKGRPLWSADDFHFLRNLYRLRFQYNQIPDGIDTQTHLAAYQQPELIYQLLHLVFKEARLNDLKTINLLLKHCGHFPQSWLEFGCGTAPVITTLFRFFNPRPEQLF